MEHDSEASTINTDDIIFDIDLFKESLEHISSSSTDNDNNDDSPSSTDDVTATEEILLTSDIESSSTTSSVSYRALPTSASLERTTSSISSDSSISFNEDMTIEAEEEKKKGYQTKQVFLPAMETVIRNLGVIQQRSMAAAVKPLITTKQQQQINKRVTYLVETDIVHDANLYSNSITNQNMSMKEVSVNNLGPREQEQADEMVRKGMKFLFDNQFMKAKTLFQKNSNSDPLHALALGAMSFIKAMMTYSTNDIQLAMETLVDTYNIAQSQIDNDPVKKKRNSSTLSSYWFNFVSPPNQTGLPKNPPPTNKSSNITHCAADGPRFLPNGVLRANVIKAESCLLMGMLQMTQESMVGYLKCGLNLKRAYHCYTIVWQEYKRMGQEYTRHMDRDTVSAIQFGIGTVHLILSSLPPKILKIFSRLVGFKSDKQLGFALLKLCLEGKGIRAPLASLMLLTYYSILSSFAPQLYAKEFTGPALECLVDSQKSHPRSCFFLFYVGRVSRIARNIPLSTQSFTFAVESSQGEWAQVAMTQMGNYEIGFNAALQLDWQTAATYFEKLSQDRYDWSPAFCQYFIGACRGMLGKRTESILAFAQVSPLAKEQAQKSCIDLYVQQKVEFFQKSGYQDLDLSLPGLELLLVWNVFDQMEKPALNGCLLIVQNTLELIYEREKLEYNIRLQELVPTSNPPDYYVQRAILLLIKAAVLNALKRHNDSIAHLNWIIDHKSRIRSQNWIVPFAYWEAGITSWGLGNYTKSRKLWESALAYTKYTFEYRMAVRLSLALSKCDQVGATAAAAAKRTTKSNTTGISTNGRKRMPIIPIS